MNIHVYTLCGSIRLVQLVEGATTLGGYIFVHFSEDLAL